MSFITKLLQSLGLRSQPRPQPTAEQYQAYHLSQWPKAGSGFLLVDGQHPKFQASVHISTESLLQWADSYSHRNHELHLNLVPKAKPQSDPQTDS